MAHNFECKKDAMRQTQDGIWKLTLTVLPEDMPMELLQAPMGSVYDLAMAPIDYDNPEGNYPDSSVVKENGITQNNNEPSINEKSTGAKLPPVELSEVYRGAVERQLDGNFKATEKTEGQKLRVRAVMICKDESFWEYARQIIGSPFPPFSMDAESKEAFTKGWLCGTCNIKSRSELATNVEAQELFRKLDQKFKDWKVEQSYAENLEREYV